MVVLYLVMEALEYKNRTVRLVLHMWFNILGDGTGTTRI